jgi:hypothetical protein
MSIPGILHMFEQQTAGITPPDDTNVDDGVALFESTTTPSTRPKVFPKLLRPASPADEEDEYRGRAGRRQGVYIRRSPSTPSLEEPARYISGREDEEEEEEEELEEEVDTQTLHTETGSSGLENLQQQQQPTQIVELKMAGLSAKERVMRFLGGALNMRKSVVGVHKQEEKRRE